jgi:uncharacterized protein YodC (DUF2158 family)
MSKQKEIVKGSVVVLKSDPNRVKMTVRDISSDTEVACDWFDVDKHLRRNTFGKGQLIVIS